MNNVPRTNGSDMEFEADLNNDKKEKDEVGEVKNGNEELLSSTNLKEITSIGNSLEDRTKNGKSTLIPSFQEEDNKNYTLTIEDVEDKKNEDVLKLGRRTRFSNQKYSEENVVENKKPELKRRLKAKRFSLSRISSQKKKRYLKVFKNNEFSPQELEGHVTRARLRKIREKYVLQRREYYEKNMKIHKPQNFKNKTGRTNLDPKAFLDTDVDKTELQMQWELGNDVRIFINDRWEDAVLIDYRHEDDSYKINFIDSLYEDELNTLQNNVIRGRKKRNSEISFYGPKKRTHWLNLRAFRVEEFREVVWAKVKGWAWWPAQIIQETEYGVVKSKGKIVQFFGTGDRSAVGEDSFKDFDENMKKYGKNSRKHFREGLKEARIAHQRWKDQKEALKKELELIAAKTQLKKFSAQELVGVKVIVYWELDDQWYPAIVSKYNKAKKRHFLVYFDHGVEWVNVNKEFVKIVSLEDNFLEKNKLSIPNDHCWECHQFVNPEDQQQIHMCFRCPRKCHSRCYVPVKPKTKTQSKMRIFCPDCLLCENCLHTHPPTIIDHDDENPHISAIVDPSKLKPSFKELSETLLMCDICEKRVHLECLDPPLKEQNIQSWICEECISCIFCQSNTPSLEYEKFLNTKKYSQLLKVNRSAGRKNTNKTIEKKESEMEEGGQKIEDEQYENDNDNENDNDSDLSEESKSSDKEIDAVNVFSKIVFGKSLNLFSPFEWLFSFSICHVCAEKFEIGQFCRVCSKPWWDAQGVKMVCCDKCDNWVHIECDVELQSKWDYKVENEGKLTRLRSLVKKDEGHIEGEYHCPACIQRLKSNEMVSFLDMIVEKDKHATFLEAVSPLEAPLYSEIIKCPMDLTTIRFKLLELEYSNLEEFKYDLNLVWRNAMDFNNPNSREFKEAKLLQDFCINMWDNVAGVLLFHKGGLKNDDEKDGLNTFDLSNHKGVKRSRGRKNKKEKKDDSLFSKLVYSNNVESAGLISRMAPGWKLQQDFPPVVYKTWIEIFSTFSTHFNLVSKDCCLVCGSFGDWLFMLLCSECGEAVHIFCVNQESLLNRCRKKLWMCPNCTICVACGYSEENEEDIMVMCDECDGVRHLKCVQPPLDEVPEGAFKCENCVVCRCCGTKDPRGPYKGNEDRNDPQSDEEMESKSHSNILAGWKDNYSLCNYCNSRQRRKKYCPLCKEIWLPDEKAPMILCEKCGLWVHLKCDDNLTPELVMELNSLIYYCPLCRENSVKLIEKNTLKTGKRKKSRRKRKKLENRKNHRLKRKKRTANSTQIIYKKVKVCFKLEGKTQWVSEAEINIGQRITNSQKKYITNTYNDIEDFVYQINSLRRRKRRYLKTRARLFTLQSFYIKSKSNSARVDMEGGKEAPFAAEALELPNAISAIVHENDHNFESGLVGNMPFLLRKLRLEQIRLKQLIYRNIIDTNSLIKHSELMKAQLLALQSAVFNGEIQLDFFVIQKMKQNLNHFFLLQNKIEHNYASILATVNNFRKEASVLKKQIEDVEWNLSNFSFNSNFSPLQLMLSLTNGCVDAEQHQMPFSVPNTMNWSTLTNLNNDIVTANVVSEYPIRSMQESSFKFSEPLQQSKSNDDVINEPHRNESLSNGDLITESNKNEEEMANMDDHMNGMKVKKDIETLTSNKIVIDTSLKTKADVLSNISVTYNSVESNSNNIKIDNDDNQGNGKNTNDNSDNNKILDRKPQQQPFMDNYEITAFPNKDVCVVEEQNPKECMKHETEKRDVVLGNEHKGSEEQEDIKIEDNIQKHDISQSSKENEGNDQSLIEKLDMPSGIIKSNTEMKLKPNVRMALKRSKRKSKPPSKLIEIIGVKEDTKLSKKKRKKQIEEKHHQIDSPVIIDLNKSANPEGNTNYVNKIVNDDVSLNKNIEKDEIMKNEESIVCKGKEMEIQQNKVSSHLYNSNNNQKNSGEPQKQDMKYPFDPRLLLNISNHDAFSKYIKRCRNTIRICGEELKRIETFKEFPMASHFKNIEDDEDVFNMVSDFVNIRITNIERKAKCKIELVESKSEIQINSNDKNINKSDDIKMKMVKGEKNMDVNPEDLDGANMSQTKKEKNETVKNEIKDIACKNMHVNVNSDVLEGVSTNQIIGDGKEERNDPVDEKTNKSELDADELSNNVEQKVSNKDNVTEKENDEVNNVEVDANINSIDVKSDIEKNDLDLQEPHDLEQLSSLKVTLSLTYRQEMGNENKEQQSQLQYHSKSEDYEDCDSRYCAICGLKGDRSRFLEGRLIPLEIKRNKKNRNLSLLSKRSEELRNRIFQKFNGSFKPNDKLMIIKSISFQSWVHIQCAIWSSETYEPEFGLLFSVSKPIRRAKESICTVCKMPRATINCCQKGCRKSYHFRCAIERGVRFTLDNLSYCPKEDFNSNNDCDSIHTVKVRDEDLITVLDLVSRKVCTSGSNLYVDNKLKESETSRSWILGFEPQLYLRVGALSVFSLGTILPNSAFHSKNYIYPVGYFAARMYWSYKNTQNSSNRSRCLYYCTIEQSKNKPLFKLRAEDDSDNVICEDSPQKAWCALRERLDGFNKRNGKRRELNSGDFDSFGLCAPHFFGFGHPSVHPLIERLPGTEQLKSYHFQYCNIKKNVNTKGLEIQSVDPIDSINIPHNENKKAEISFSGCKRVDGFDRQLIGFEKKFGFDAHDKSSLNLQTAVTKDSTSKRTVNMVEDNKENSKQGLLVRYRQFKTREEQPIVAPSQIHKWGLFATIHYEPSDIVMEFVGEIIHQKVADLREKLYEKNNIGSCYMFRVDSDTIIDATMRGNTSRYCNHSCDPNCFSQVFDDGQMKRILFVAKNQIFPGEELTYDYQMASEEGDENKILCHCGAAKCSGRMN